MSATFVITLVIAVLVCRYIRNERNSKRSR